MVDNTNDMVRLSLNIPHTLSKRLDSHIPWGLKNAIFVQLAEHLCDVMDREGGKKILYLMAESRINIAESAVEGKEF